jgi:5'-nucleotidase
MRILIANDDGIYSPGIAALAKVAKRFGEVRIVAPDVEQSSMGHAITHSRPLSYRKTDLEGVEAFRVNGTPADCVALGVHLWEDVDVVLSGINLGANLGNGMWHSGTLAAAKQATLLGCRGIALSTPAEEGDPDFAHLDAFVERALSLLLEQPSLPLINVNFPSRPRGFRWTFQSVRHYDGRVVAGRDPMGRRHYWVTVRPLETTEEGSDRWAFENGFVTMTPLRLDLTDRASLQLLSANAPLADGEIDVDADTGARRGHGGDSPVATH